MRPYILVVISLTSVLFLSGCIPILAAAAISSTSDSRNQTSQQSRVDSERPAQAPVEAIPREQRTEWAGAMSYPSVSEPVAGLEQRGDDVALIVGIESYAFLPDVAGARQTAYDWEDFFRDSLGLRDVYTLLDEDATAEEIEAYIEEISADVDPDARLWFVFVGHGAPDPGGQDGLLVGMDARQNMMGLTTRSISRSQVITALSSGSTDDVVVILDTCFSGQTPAGAPLIAGAQPVIPLMESRVVAEGALILSAAQADQLAGPLTGEERPSFSYLLLGAMRGWAVDGQGDISGDNAHRFVERQLRHVTSRRQRPQIEGPADRVLIRNATEATPDISHLLAGRAPTRRELASASPHYDRAPRFTGGQPSSSAAHVGRGLHLELGHDWSLTQNEAMGSDGHQWIADGHGGEILIQLHHDKGRRFEANVDVIIESALESGAVLESMEDGVAIGPHRGSLRTFRNQRRDTGRPTVFTLYFVRQQSNLWLFAARVDADHDDIDAFMEEYTQFVAATRWAAN